MIKAGIIGAGGYAGETLISILLDHPDVEISYLMSEEAHRGKNISELYPHFLNVFDMKVQKTEAAQAAKGVDVVFLALPHGLAMDIVPSILEKGVKVIDLGADYRIRDVKVYEKWYQKHTDSKNIEEAVYGLPELYKEKIKKASLIANPGCYPTAAILGTAPLLKEGLVESGTVIVDAKSGVSGAGVSLSRATHYPDCNEGIAAYKIASHRHSPEIDQELSFLAGEKVNLLFVPHLTPMSRGILETIYLKPKERKSTSHKGTSHKLDLNSVYKKFYQKAPFVRVLENGKLPNTKYVSGTNFCDISATYDPASDCVIVSSAIDNLVKGAAGQAVQNMNLMFGFDEKAGLDRVAVYP